MPVKLVPRALDRDAIEFTLSWDTNLWRSNPTGTRVIYADKNHLHLWDTETGQEITRIEHPEMIATFEWSPDATMIATVCDDKVLRVWDSETRKLLLEYHDPAQPISFFYPSWDGAQVICWASDSKAITVPVLDATCKLIKIAVLVGKTNGWSGLWANDRNAVGLMSLTANQQRLHVWEGYGTSHVMDQDLGNHEFGFGYDWNSHWHPDSRRLIGNSGGVVRAYDAASRRRLGTLLPGLPDRHWLCVGPTGHCRGSKGVAEHIVYVAQLDDGSNITLSPQEFTQRFGWKNNPEKATLLDFNE
jgi:WD40 repeat protein